jgi:hypothetical protein
MSITVQCVPHDRLLGHLISSAKDLLWLCSPFVTADGVETVLQASAKVRLITKATAANLSTKALDANALLRMLDAGAEIRSIPNLHAKIYLIDRRYGVVTSSNLTGSGLYQNVELGLYFSDEEAIYQSVSDVFERFWARSVPVSVEGLERLTCAGRVATFDRGVWIKQTADAANESLVPAPVIGYLEVPDIPAMFSKEVAATAIVAFDDRPPESDESGDLFGVLPRSGLGLQERLGSANPQIVQVALNALDLTAPNSFRNWLDSLPESDLRALSSPDNPYPYKSRVIERIIRDGSPRAVVDVVRALSTDPTNESQFLKYLPMLEGRRHSDPHEWATAITPTLVDVAREIATMVSLSTATTKNFARPNIDRLTALLTNTKLEPQLQTQVADLYRSLGPAPTPQTETVPGYQSIKRSRESLGDAFRDWAFAHLVSIRAGAWDEQLSSLISLFKELDRISLSADDRCTIRTLAADVCRRLDAVAADRRATLQTAADEWERTIDPSWLVNNRYQLAAARKELLPFGQQAVTATGRWVSLYGQCVKGGHAPAHNLMKDEIDWLTTYLTARKTLTAWIDPKEKKGKKR